MEKWQDRVKELMQRKGIGTVGELSRLVDLSKGTLSLSTKEGYDAKLSTINKLARALGVSAKWLLYGEEETWTPVPLLTGDLIGLYFSEDTLIREQQAIMTNILTVYPGGMFDYSKRREDRDYFAIESGQHGLSPYINKGDTVILSQPLPKEDIRRCGTDRFVLAGASGEGRYHEFFLARLEIIGYSVFLYTSLVDRSHKVEYDRHRHRILGIVEQVNREFEVSRS
ncbi:hypothetical protein CI610_00328 [invertebrate metagenome]|uniref:HTH cro/C1-type domain-containing protein n=1 Tax=invertebrate metagenome TaxID=1711999 RepID=A0A2H9TBU2_9ZZZZ